MSPSLPFRARALIDTICSGSSVARAMKHRFRLNSHSRSVYQYRSIADANCTYISVENGDWAAEGSEVEGGKASLQPTRG